MPNRRLPGQTRPRTYASHKTPEGSSRVMGVVANETLREIDRFANEAGVSRSFVIAQALQLYIQQQRSGDGNGVLLLQS